MPAYFLWRISITAMLLKKINNAYYFLHNGYARRRQKKKNRAYSEFEMGHSWSDMHFGLFFSRKIKRIRNYFLTDDPISLLALFHERKSCLTQLCSFPYIPDQTAAKTTRKYFFFSEISFLTGQTKRAAKFLSCAIERFFP